MIVLDVKHMSRWMVESSRVGDVIVSAAKKIGISRAMVEANSITIQCMVDDFLANEYSYHGNDTADMTEKDDAIIAISERLEEHVSGKRHLGARTISDTISYPFEKLENIGLLGFTRAESMYVLESGTACDSGGQWFTTYEAVVRLRPTGKDDNKADLRRVVGVFANKDDAAFFLMRLGREHKIRNVTIG